MAKKIRVDLACGNNKRASFIGVDLTKNGTQADIEHDLETYPWPFQDNSIDELFCSHFIEHTADLVAFINEVWRVMKPNATVQFVAPYYTSVRAFQDPTHKRFISEQLFLYFDREWRQINGLWHYPLICDLKIEEVTRSLNQAFQNRSAEDVAFAAMHYWNVIDDISVTLRKPG